MSDPTCRHLEVASVLTGPDPDKDAVWVCVKPQCRQRFSLTPTIEGVEIREILQGLADGSVQFPSVDEMTAMAKRVIEVLPKETPPPA